MVRERLEGIHREYFRFELRSWAKEAGLRIPMPARGSFGYPICPWCGDSEFGDNPAKYAEHVLGNHKEDLKPYVLKSSKLSQSKSDLAYAKEHNRLLRERRELESGE